jgi:polysaccharide pyruvyl transferase WcaK-like protein
LFRYPSNPPWDYQPQKIHFQKWQASVDSLSNDSVFIRLLDKIDLVVVNMEGTIHHNKLGSLSLLGIAYAAKKVGKKVWMVNGTIQSVNPSIVKLALQDIDYVAVREPFSWRWLKDLDIDVNQSADCAFLSNIFNDVDRDLPILMDDKQPCLYTPGILSREFISNGRNIFSIIRQVKILKKHGWNPVYLEINENSFVSSILTNLRIPCVRVDDIKWSGIGSYLKKFRLVVSGRYHILIFAAMAGVPFIPMSSNSWKIEGLMELLDMNALVANNAQDLDVACRSGIVRCESVEDYFNLARHNVREDLLI